MEALSNQEEVDLRAKIEALKLEVTKVPSQSIQNAEDAEVLCSTSDHFLSEGFLMLQAVEIITFWQLLGFSVCY